jgi:hypothetical protein
MLDFNSNTEFEDMKPAQFFLPRGGNLRKIPDAIFNKEVKWVRQTELRIRDVNIGS